MGDTFFILQRRDQTMDVIILKLEIGQAIGSFLDTRIGGTKANTIEVLGIKSHERVEWQVMRCVTHQ